MLDVENLERRRLRIAVQDAADVPVGLIRSGADSCNPLLQMEDWIAGVFVPGWTP